MTTIATDGKSMAADRLVTGDNIRHGEVSKLRTTKDGSIIGLSGTAFLTDKFLEWYESDRSTPFESKDSMEALVLRPDGTVLCFDQNGDSFEHPVPAVCGSGSAVALGALDAGATPAEAVAIAIKRDISSGGSVDVCYLV